MLINNIKALLVGLALSLNVCYATDDTKGFEVPTTFTPNTQSAWDTISFNLAYGIEHTVILKWQGRGGDVDMGMDFILDILNAQEKHGKQVNAIMTGNSYSMHSLTVCYVDHLYSEDTSYFLMFHSVGYRSMGVYYRTDNTPYKFMFDECIDRGILTAKQYEQIQHGFVVYYYPMLKVSIVQKDPRPYGNG